MRSVDLVQRLEHDRRVNRDGAVHRLVEPEVSRRRMDIAVEDQANEVGVLVNERTAGVATGDVCRGDQVERRRQIDRVLGLEPAGREA